MRLYSRKQVQALLRSQFGEDYLPSGIYHLNLVPCTCPSPLKKVSRKIQSLFRKKITKTNCKVHTPKSFRKI